MCSCGGRYELVVEIICPEKDYVEIQLECENCKNQKTVKEPL